MSELEDLLAEAAEITKPSLDGLGRISAAAQKFRELERKRETLLNAAKELGDQIAVITEKDIPALFDEYKIREFVMDDGSSLALKPIYVGKITDDTREQAYEWLENNGYGNLVKTTVEARFGMGEFEKARTLADQLEKQGFVVNAGQSVHSSTLGKFIKTMTLADKDIPVELFHPTILRRAVFS